MHQPTLSTVRGVILSGLLLLGGMVSAAPARSPDLVGIESGTGDLYLIDTSDAAVEAVGTTGLTEVGAFEYHPEDDVFYAITMGVSAALYRIDASGGWGDLLVEEVGPLGVFCFEGGLAFAEDGTAYLLNGGAITPYLLTVNLETGAASVVGPMEARHDFGGLGWRADQMLVGLDSTTNSLRAIDPVTAVSTPIKDVDADPAVGNLGGMALADNGQGYFVTAGPGAPVPGSNALYSFNATTGTHTEIGDFAGEITGPGFAGLAFVPEPATLGLLAVGSLVLLRRRR